MPTLRCSSSWIPLASPRSASEAKEADMVWVAEKNLFQFQYTLPLVISLPRRPFRSRESRNWGGTPSDTAFLSIPQIGTWDDSCSRKYPTWGRAREQKWTIVKDSVSLHHKMIFARRTFKSLTLRTPSPDVSHFWKAFMMRSLRASDIGGCSATEKRWF